MRENHYEIVSFRIVKIDCDIGELLDLSEISLSGEDAVMVQTPSSSDEKLVRLEIKSKISSDEIENFKFEILSQTIFAFQQEPDDFPEEIRTYCYPLAKEKIQEAVKEITKVMGINPIDFTKAQ